MPDRIIRQGILNSDAVNTLSPAAEVFYRRLFSVADDYGRYDGRIPILLAALYALQLDRVKAEDISAFLGEVAEAGLVQAYESDGKPYLEIKKFGARMRAARSKWPQPPTSDGLPLTTASQAQASADKCPPMPAPVCNQTADESGTPSMDDSGGQMRPYSDSDSLSGADAKKRKPRHTSLPDDFNISKAVNAWAQQKGFTRLPERLEHFRNWAISKDHTYADWDAAFRNAISGDYAKLNGSSGGHSVGAAPANKTSEIPSRTAAEMGLE